MENKLLGSRMWFLWNLRVVYFPVKHLCLPYIINKVIGRNTKIISSYAVVWVIQVWVTESKIIVNVWRKFRGNWVWFELVRVWVIESLLGIGKFEPVVLGSISRVLNQYLRGQEFKSLTSHTSQAFRLSFCNCKRCVCNYINWDDLLHSIAACMMGFFFTTIAFWYNNLKVHTFPNQDQWHYDCPCSTAPY